MTHYSVQQIDQIFVKAHEFLSFTKNTSKNISKNLCSKENHRWSKVNIIILYSGGISKHNRRNEQSQFRKRNWLEINDTSRGTYKNSNEIKNKTSMIRWNLCEYSNAFILVRGTITVTGADHTLYQIF